MQKVKLIKILLNEKFFIKLINRQKFKQIISYFKIHIDEYFKMSLTTDKLDIFIKYIKILMNVKNIQVNIKT